MRKLLSFLWVIFLLLTCASTAQAQEEFFFSEKRWQRPNRTSERDHGYAPRPFSEQTNSFVTTPEEEGHYILGSSQEIALYRPTATFADKSVQTDVTRVLISRPRIQETPEDLPSLPVKPTIERPTRFNDSLDLERVIREHKWTTTLLKE